MSINKFTKTEIILDALAIGFLLFVMTNANTNLGTAYQFFIYAAIFFLTINIMDIFGGGVRVTFQKKEGGWVEAIIAGAVGWGILLIVSFVILKVVDPIKASFGSIISSLGAANPVFSDSKIINFITVGIAISYAETMLWARGTEFIADILRIPINRRNKFLISFVSLAIILSIFFAVFHITAKGIHSTSSLIIVGAMMFISLAMIAYYDGEARQAVFLHVIANSVAAAMLLTNGGLLS